MQHEIFKNDFHEIFSFGKYKGKRIMDVPDEYFWWFHNNIKKEGKEIDAIKRIAKRRGVTTLIKNIKITPTYIPNLLEISAKFKPVHRPDDINPCLFGSFIEYFIKSILNLSIDDEPRELLALYGLEKCPNHLSMQNDDIVKKPSRRILWIYASYKKEKRSIEDICNLSFSHSILMEGFKERDAADLFRYVKENKEYFDTWGNSLAIPIPDESRETCDKISVGCVIGVIDLISNGSIIDIKCCKNDDIEYYKKQLFTYSCLHYLRYGDIIQRCEIYNFITGKQYVMILEDCVKNNAREFIKNLGNHCPEHLKLFMQS